MPTQPMSNSAKSNLDNELTWTGYVDWLLANARRDSCQEISRDAKSLRKMGYVHRMETIEYRCSACGCEVRVKPERRHSVSRACPSCSLGWLGMVEGVEWWVPTSKFLEPPYVSDAELFAAALKKVGTHHDGWRLDE